MGSIGRLAVTFGIGAAVAAGFGCQSAWADSPEAAGSADPLLNELVTATQGVSSDAAIPASSTGDGLLSSLLTFFDGVNPAPSTPGDFVNYSGEPSLADRLLVFTFDALEPLEKLLGVNYASLVTPLLIEDSPPAGLESSAGLTVTETQYDGMPVYELTPADPSGDYVIALHGGAFVDPPTLLHWEAYTDMAEKTDATIVVPIYPLATDGGSASTVDPEIANLISSEISAEGANHVSVYGDSAGGTIALAAAELLASEGKPEPFSMVLDSPAVDLSYSNPDITFVNDPILNVADAQQDGLLWAGDLPLTSPLVSPIYGSLAGLPPTYVYSGSDEILAPDELRLEQDAIAQDAPFSFILRSGEVHDWALQTSGDGGQVQEQIYQELGLTDATGSAATGDSGLLDALANGLHNLSTELSSETSTSGSLLGDLSTDLANGLATMSTDVSGLSGDFSTIVADIMATF